MLYTTTLQTNIPQAPWKDDDMPTCTQEETRITLACADLAGSTAIADMLEAELGPLGVLKFHDQIEGMIKEAISRAGASPAKVVFKMLGDGGILKFDSVEAAHKFSIALHDLSLGAEPGDARTRSRRYFRVGISTGNAVLADRNGIKEIGGTVVHRAVRLQSRASPGGTLIDQASFDDLPPTLRASYLGPKTLPGKSSQELYVCHELANSVTHTLHPSGQDCSQDHSIDAIFDLFEKLRPKDQIESILNRIGMPVENRPSKMLTIAERFNGIISWADNDIEILKRICEILRKLTKKNPGPTSA
ncbi:MAG: adenylate/guanylate cyclase domain-containing protein [Magnetococcales bacterium]|nr:adenylate/guanylate cyclase domain-containing protein [Magnetococcales bacterium]